MTWGKFVSALDKVKGETVQFKKLFLIGAIQVLPHGRPVFHCSSTCTGGIWQEMMFVHQVVAPINSSVSKHTKAKGLYHFFAEPAYDKRAFFFFFYHMFLKRSLLYEKQGILNKNVLIWTHFFIFF